MLTEIVNDGDGIWAMRPGLGFELNEEILAEIRSRSSQTAFMNSEQEV